MQFLVNSFIFESYYPPFECSSEVYTVFSVLTPSLVSPNRKERPIIFSVVTQEKKTKKQE